MICTIIILLIMNVILMNQIYYIKKKKIMEEENRSKTIETIEILLNKQIEYIKKGEEKTLQEETGKYIKDFLLSELMKSRFMEMGLNYAHIEIIRKIPEVSKYYKQRMNHEPKRKQWK